MGRVAGLSPEETRRRVLDGAVTVFGECGFEGARVTEIAKAAGLSSGAMYNHFDSKAELLAAVVQRHAGNQLMTLLASAETSGLLDAVLARAKQFGRGRLEAPLLIEAICAARRDTEVRDALVGQVMGREGVFVELVGQAQEAGEMVSDVDPQAVARFTLMLLLGSLLVQALELPDMVTDGWDGLVTRVVDAFRPGGS